MTLLFGESYDWLTSATLLTRKWTTKGAVGTYTFEAGRTGNCLKLTHSSNNVLIEETKGIGAGIASGVFGAALKTDHILQRVGLTLFDVATEQLSVWTEADGSVTLRRGNRAATIIAQSASGLISAGVFFYMELKATIDNAVGSAIVQIDGTIAINVSGADTQATANSTFNVIGHSTYTVSTQGSYIDDTYFCDLNGSVNNDFLGSVKIHAIFPTGAGANTDWTPNTGANYAAVDDANPDDATTYIQSDTPGNKDTYVFGNLPAGVWDVLAIQHNIMAQASARTIRGLERVGGVDYETATATPAATYNETLIVTEISPDTAVAWTQAEIDASEFGVKVQA